MTITRKSQTPIMHRSVAYNGVAYFGGVVGADMTKGMEEQTRSITERLDALLADAGTDKTRILSAMIYVSDFSAKAEMNKAWSAWIDGPDLPARATIGVGELGEDCLVEVVITAAV
ncbi:MAG: RidA family protein [Paracoccus sp. (in: a-proteobacteria)]|nr:RidA family protein [Paracoccus sp. (in: a-proteobacteria)]